MRWYSLMISAAFLFGNRICKIIEFSEFFRAHSATGLPAEFYNSENYVLAHH